MRRSTLRAHDREDVKESVERAHGEITAFLLKAKEPALLEPGQEPIPLVCGAYEIELSGNRLFVQAWTRDRTLARRITGVDRRVNVSHTHSLQLTTERFGKREGTLELVDLAAPKAQVATRKASRQTYREQFRRSLLRQFPGWQVSELSTDPDLEHSLSPTYPRAVIRKGKMAYAAIGCPPDAVEVDGVLSFGIIWLNHVRAREVRARERDTSVRGLAIFVPEGRHRTVCLRVLYLRATGTDWRVYVYTARAEEQVDVRDYGNLATVLPQRGGPMDAEREWWTKRLATIPDVTEREEHGGAVSWTVHGLEFARWQPGKSLVFGLETKQKGLESNAAEIEGLARQLGHFRAAHAADRTHPLYLKRTEFWLEEQVRAALREIDASLDDAAVYRQAPAMTGGERSVLDLLACDHAGRLSVVEVKASEDLHLPLQALDYWIRVRWHALRDEFRAAGYFPGKTLQTVAPRLLLVAPVLSLHPTTDGILHHLHPEVDVRTIGVAMDWRERIRVMFRKSSPARP
jgi:hypothetical protein